MSKKKTNEQFIKELKEINPTLVALSPYENAQMKIQIKCSICGNIWDTRPSSLLSGIGCPKCGQKSKSNKLRKSNDVFLSDLYAVNNEIEILEAYRGNNVKLLSRCKICGHEWKVTPHDLLSGHGCPICSQNKQKNSRRSSHNIFLNHLQIINPGIDVLDEYVNNHTKIRFQCKKCGRIWTTVPNSVLSGHGCPDCAHFSTSFFEQVILQSFSLALGDEVISRDRSLIGMELDIVVPLLKVAFEPGSWDWHYDKVNIDTYKREKCDNIGYQLITIYTDYDLKEAPFSTNCFTFRNNLGYSNWNETKNFAKELLNKYNLALEEDQWDMVKGIAIEKSKKRNNDDFIEILQKINPKIKVIGTYKNSSTKISFQCLECFNTWETTPSVVLSGHGCPVCGKRRSAKAKQKSHDQFVAEMNAINPNIVILGKYKNSKEKLLCKCSACNNIWEIRPQNLLKGQGCPKCGELRTANKNRKNHDYFVEELSQKNPAIVVQGRYINNHTKIEVSCKTCGYLWHANPTDILNGHGCPKCAGKVKKTNAQFLKELVMLFPNIEPLDKYQSANKKLHVRCLDCNYIWEIRPHDLLRSKGCPNCRKNGRKAT